MFDTKRILSRIGGKRRMAFSGRGIDQHAYRRSRRLIDRRIKALNLDLIITTSYEGVGPNTPQGLTPLTKSSFCNNSCEESSDGSMLHDDERIRIASSTRHAVTVDYNLIIRVDENTSIGHLVTNGSLD